MSHILTEVSNEVPSPSSLILSDPSHAAPSNPSYPSSSPLPTILHPIMHPILHPIPHPILRPILRPIFRPILHPIFRPMSGLQELMREMPRHMQGDSALHEAHRLRERFSLRRHPLVLDALEPWWVAAQHSMQARHLSATSPFTSNQPLFPASATSHVISCQPMRGNSACCRPLN